MKNLSRPSKRFRLGGGLAAGICLICLAAPLQAKSASIYRSIPLPLPGNIASLGFEATSAREFGDRVKFGPMNQRLLTYVDVAMSSWGCEYGGWTGPNACVTTPGAKFSHPITLNIYDVNESDPAVPGALLANITQVFDIPYRPSADPFNCTGGTWYDSDDDACYNGYAVIIRFDLESSKLILPDEVILGVSYNTTHHGYNPIGENSACYWEDGGCGYDSLNVGADGFRARIGVDVDPNGVFVDYWSGFYCDGGAGGSGFFRLDTATETECWLGYTPTFAVHAVPVPRPRKK